MIEENIQEMEECPTAPEIEPPGKAEEMDSPSYSLMGRPGYGSSGRSITLAANLFEVSIKSSDRMFYQYNVKVTSSENKVIKGKLVGRRVIDKLNQIHSSDLGGKAIAYDGGQIIYTMGPLPKSAFEFFIALEESFADSSVSLDEHAKRAKRSFQSKHLKVEISYCTEIPLLPVTLSAKDTDFDGVDNALRVLDVILRHQAAQKGCLLVRQSSFTNDSRNLLDLGGGLYGVRGLHSSFQLTQTGLYLNTDVATTVVPMPGPVLDFLLATQNVREAHQIDWQKAGATLRKLRIKTKHTNLEYKVNGLSEKPCYMQSFPLRKKNDGSSMEEAGEQIIETTVFDYFTKHRGLQLSYSKHMPCLDVGKPKYPKYLPIELCSLVSLQHFKKALSPAHRLSLAEKSRQKPKERMKVLSDALSNYNFDEEPLLAAGGISLEKQFIQLEARVLEPPKLKVGKGEECIPCNGRWNFSNKQLQSPVNIVHWAIVNFSSSCDTSYLSRELISCGMVKGMRIDRPFALVEEDRRIKNSSPLVRVDEMFEKLQDKLPGEPEFILCVLPERKHCDLYGPWKMRSLTKFGIVTQCVCPVKITNNYLSNVLLKINAKLGGTNSLLALEMPPCVPIIKDAPTMILGMDVSHGSPGCLDSPSIAAVVGSLSWPLISSYRAVVRTQAPKVEIIQSLHKPLANGDDDGSIRELLKDFYTSNGGHKPKQIIIFRDGVGESQFHQVLNVELEQIKQAYHALGEEELPKFTVIVAQKNHHIRLFQAGSSENVPPGTIVDRRIVHSRNFDFYMCAHTGMFGTLRPIHYHVLLDEIGFSPDELQNFIHTLCYVNQRSTSAVSVVAPICYAHLAARQVGQFMKLEMSKVPSEQEDSTTTEFQLPELPKLHENVRHSMFFC